MELRAPQLYSCEEVQTSTPEPLRAPQLHSCEEVQTSQPGPVLFLQSCEQKSIRNTSIRVADFGSATFDHEHHTTIVATRHYRPPEVILGENCTFWGVSGWGIGEQLPQDDAG